MAGSTPSPAPPARAGADTLVAGVDIFGAADIAGAFQDLEQAVRAAAV